MTQSGLALSFSSGLDQDSSGGVRKCGTPFVGRTDRFEEISLGQPVFHDVADRPGPQRPVNEIRLTVPAERDHPDLIISF